MAGRIGFQRRDQFRDWFWDLEEEEDGGMTARI